jgi:hypothetical protein
LIAISFARRFKLESEIIYLGGIIELFREDEVISDYRTRRVTRNAPSNHGPAVVANLVVATSAAGKWNPMDLNFGSSFSNTTSR